MTEQFTKPSDEEIMEVVANVRGQVADSLRSGASRTKYVRAGGALVVAGVLFAGGMAVGGATSTDAARAAVDQEFECYSSSGSATPSIGGTVPAFLDEARTVPNPHLEAIREDPLAFCRDGFASAGAYDASIDAVAAQIGKGALCGYVELGDGSHWGFLARGGGDVSPGWYASPAPGALGEDCVMLNIAASVDNPFATGFVCGSPEQRILVFGGSAPEDGFCAARGSRDY
jgi:hypothetical protein